jgi:single-strand DNA-binding protein
MSIGVNKSIMLGHVGKNPETRSTNGGTIVASLHSPPATSKWTARETGRTGRSGITFVAFDGNAGVVLHFVRKSSQLLIEGLQRLEFARDLVQ